MVQHNAIDHTGLTGAGGSFGSNANQVSTANTAGASTLHSAADHVHRGVSSIAHSSNTFYGPVTFTTEGDLGITSPSTGTLAFKAISGSGGGAAAGADLGFASYTRTSGDYTTTSTSFVDIDATNLAFTVTNGGAHRVRVVLAATAVMPTTGFALELLVDTVAVGGGTAGMSYGTVGTNNYPINVEYLTAVLAAGSHTYKWQWKNQAAGTVTLRAGTVAPSPPLRAWVEETNLTT